MADRPDIIIKKRKKACILLGMAIPANRNVTHMEAEKNLTYKSLCLETE
jgi:hypothetical protein